MGITNHRFGRRAQQCSCDCALLADCQYHEIDNRLVGNTDKYFWSIAFSKDALDVNSLSSSFRLKVCEAVTGIFESLPQFLVENRFNFRRFICHNRSLVDGVCHDKCCLCRFRQLQREMEGFVGAWLQVRSKEDAL